MNAKKITIDGVTYALMPVEPPKVPPGFPVRIGNLEWSATLCNGKNVNYADAEKACAALGEGWRIPTVEELFVLADRTRCRPAIDTDVFPDTESDYYWTSTPYAWGPSGLVWVVDFLYGVAYDYHRDNAGAYVRAVRSVPEGEQ